MRLADARATRRLDAKQGGSQPTLVCPMPSLRTPATGMRAQKQTTHFLWNSCYPREGSLTT